MEYVVLCLHGRVARVSAVRKARGIGGETARWDIVVEHRVSPPAGCRKSLAILFHDESLGKEVWHIHIELCLCALLLLPLELDDHGAIRKRLAAAGNAGLEGRDHGRIGDDHFLYWALLRGRDDGPVLVSPEVGERNSARRYQRVLVWRVGRCDNEHSERCHSCRNQSKAGETPHSGARLCFLFLSHRFRSKLKHGLFSFKKKVSINVRLE